MACTRPNVYQNFIDGEWVESSTGETFENRNPADTRDLVGIFPKSAKADVNAAVDAAKRAFLKWRLVPAPRRAEIIYLAAEMLAERKEDYARDMTREMGKVLKETRGDVQEAVDTAYYMAGEGRRLFGPTTPSELPNKFAMAVRMPVGVCGMITPWNFPMAIPSWKFSRHSYAGIRASSSLRRTPLFRRYNLVRVLTDAGVPKGVINIVCGFGPEAGAPLLEHPDVRAISFTGSSVVGRTIGTAAAKSFKHCSLELGGKNPMIVLDDANLELALEGALWGAFGTTGQRCTATSRIIVEKGVYHNFVDRLVERARKLRVGNGLDETTDMGPAVNERQLKTDLEYIEIGREEGAKTRYAAAIAWRRAICSMAVSWNPPFSATSIQKCASPRRKSSDRWFRSFRARTLRTQFKSLTTSNTGSRRPSILAMSIRPSQPCAISTQASPTSMLRRLEPKFTCLLAGSKLPAMAIVKAGSARSISTANGSPFT